MTQIDENRQAKIDELVDLLTEACDLLAEACIELPPKLRSWYAKRYRNGGIRRSVAKAELRREIREAADAEANL